MQSWESEGLWKKAKLFMDQAGEHDQASSAFAFFASLSIECLGRSALTKIHPVLNADPRDDSNILYACGYSLAKPRSLPAHSVFIRLEKIIKSFQSQHRELCEFLALQRNAHVHTADLPYEGLSTDKWLARFYDTIRILHDHLEKPLEHFLGPDGASMAAEMIKTLNASVLKTVREKINAHSKVFSSKSPSEKESVLRTSELSLAFPASNQEVCTCVSCGGKASLIGKKYKELQEQYVDGDLYMIVEYISVSYLCKSCGLSLSSIEEIAHAGLKTHFTKTESTNLHDLYEHDYQVEYDNM
ncbi:hypothetical protein [Nitrospirillum viridazoti]|uniref:hypothetical protein n=1 Tax=Nitrospirillum viridazoti TaxID=3144925 RepID=UPI0011AA4601|nr:hypothetical protein [Nitrospirillum amazonense]TWB44713.1 hypothetical protein FBZ91_101184 [Nitrospirillum amazonense]